MRDTYTQRILIKMFTTFKIMSHLVRKKMFIVFDGSLAFSWRENLPQLMTYIYMVIHPINY